MKFKNLAECVQWLEKENELVRVTEEVDPDLEMAEITRRVFSNNGPAVFFENIRQCRFPAVSNLFGTYERALKILEPEFSKLRQLIKIKSDPAAFFKHPLSGVRSMTALLHAWPVQRRKNTSHVYKTAISQLPLIKCWPGDGGAFVLLPQVFSMDPDSNSIRGANLGMYRVQISGGDYAKDKEAGLHYQLHRGIGNHHLKALEKGEPLNVSIFIGGPPAHALAAVMPMPEHLSELFFAGALAGRNFRYARESGHVTSLDADFCITGRIVPGRTRKEGPFGDHLGYYSLAHEFPYLEVRSVTHRKGAVYPFTVVGRPPQEDTVFGRLIHELAGPEIPSLIPGVTKVHAVDAAGVHPLLFATAKERYVPYEPRRPRELLTHANAILGTGQLSLAKYLLICADQDRPSPDIYNEKEFICHVLERMDFAEDLHFQTRTTIDTLDYSSSSLNRGSKVIMAAAGEKKRTLKDTLPAAWNLPRPFSDAAVAAPGIVAVKGPLFETYLKADSEMKWLAEHLAGLREEDGIALVVVAEDPVWMCRDFSNFLWVTFTRSNPSHDIHGVRGFTRFKHWGCRPPLIIDARIKPFHAPSLIPDSRVSRRVDALGASGKSLHGII
ncbi:MAG: UbiD family decarboxylase [Desulfobacteraceae bacterium]